MDKEKQIDEMARIIDDNHGFIVSSVETAKVLYNAGYRKQREGEWIYVQERVDMDIEPYICSYCKGYAEFESNYCPSCGAKMKGGAK